MKDCRRLFRKDSTIWLLIVAFVMIPLGVFSQPMETPVGARCAQCGMKVDKASPFIAQMITKEGKQITFCDIGDMLSHYKKMKEKPDSVFVKDIRSDTWLDATLAHYVKSTEFSTPMGWGIAAFKERENASKKGEVMTFEKAQEMLGERMHKMMMH